MKEVCILLVLITYVYHYAFSVLRGSWNKQRLFLYTSLTYRFL